MKNSVLKFIRITVGLQHSRYVRSGGTTNFREYLPLLFIQPRRCFIILRSCLKASKDIKDRLLICMLNIYPHESGSLDMSGLVDQSGSSVWNHGTGAAVDQLPGRSASFPFTLICYHYCYGVESHKRKQPCTEPADP
ncbi:hypothetical protein T10_3840 [Trichinella papuae]|uniref:Uncharacterized protein n=1 Tax=Trichinella papuae TaxID=268474 RepID=A0A0V1MMK9_9BILA|nr:hypothetical protein T10_3840 [Trichinella papuae]